MSTMTTDNRYRETLHRWASQFVPDGAVVTGVVMRYDDGYDPTFTDRPESLDVGVIYRIPAVVGSTDEVDITQHVTSVGELLTELFAIEESTE